MLSEQIARQITRASQLKAFARAAPGGTHYFDRSTMKFFGDTMRNYGVRHVSPGVIELYRIKPVKNGLKGSSLWQVSDCGTYCVRTWESTE